METVVRYYPGTLAAGQLVTFETVGDYIFLLSNTGAAASLKVSINNQQFHPIPVGIILKTDTVFNRVQFLNTDSSSTDFVAILGQGEIDYKALVIGNTVSVNVANTPAITYEKATASVDDGSQVALSAEGQIYAASTTRKGAIINNPITNGKLYIRFGSTTVTVNNCFAVIEPGVIYEIPIQFLNLELRGLMATSGQKVYKAEV